MARRYHLGFVRRTVNLVARTALRLGWAPRGLVLLTTRGRKSGLVRSTPAKMVELDGRRYLVAPYGEVGWVHNVRASGSATVSRARRSEQVAVTQVGPEEAARVLQRYLDLEPMTRPLFEVRHDAPPEAFRAVAALHPAFRLSPASASTARRLSRKGLLGSNPSPPAFYLRLCRRR